MFGRGLSAARAMPAGRQTTAIILKAAIRWPVAVTVWCMLLLAIRFHRIHIPFDRLLDHAADEEFTAYVVAPRVAPSRAPGTAPRPPGRSTPAGKAHTG